MSESKETILVRVNLEMSTEALKTIVRIAREIVGPDEEGIYRVDTADRVGEMISKFLLEENFNDYVREIDNYPR